MKIDNIPLSPEEEKMYNTWLKVSERKPSDPIFIRFIEYCIRKRRKEKESMSFADEAIEMAKEEAMKTTYRFKANRKEKQ